MPIKELFASQRAAHNEELHKAGGSPTNEYVWAAFQGRSLKGAKGKFIFKQLKNKVPANAFSEAAVDSLVAYPERAASLKANLEDLLALPRRTGSETVRFSCSTLDPAALDNEFSAYVVCQ